MSVAPPPGPPPTGTAVAAAATQQAAALKILGEVVVEQVPARIASLSRTILLSGTIAAQQEGGSLVLRTQIGELVIRSPVPLPMDQVLTLQIPPGVPPVRAQVAVMPVHVAGTQIATSPAPAASQGATPTTSPAIPVQNAAPSGVPASRPVVSTPSQVIGSGTVVQGGVSLQAVEVQPLLPGSVIPARVLAVPQFVPEGVAHLPLPQSAEVAAQVQQAGAPALKALLPQNLADVVAKLPPAVLVPERLSSDQQAPAPSLLPTISPVPPRGAVSAVPAAAAPQPPIAIPATSPAVGAAGAMPSAQVSIPAPASAAPAFASLPVMLTLPPGASVTLQVERVLPPPAVPVSGQASGQVSGPAAAPVSSSAPVLQQAATPQPVVHSQPVPVPQAGAPLSAALVPRIPMPTATATAVATTDVRLASQPPVIFQAVVSGQTPQAEPIVTSPAGLLVLASRAPLATGTVLELSLVHVSELPAGEADVPAPPRDWPVLHQAFAAMPVAQLGLGSRMARSDNLGSAVLFLMAALKLGDVKTYLGDEATQQLAQRAPDLLARLATEFQQMGQSFNRPEAAATEWRTLNLPVLPEAQWSRLAVHLRHEREAQTASVAPIIKHLVVEVEMSRLGPLLLDGYIRPRQFDLTLRSQRRLPKELRQELRTACNDTLAAAGWRGSLEFQTAAELWLKG